MGIGSANLMKRMSLGIPVNGVKNPCQASARPSVTIHECISNGAEMVALLNTMETPVYVPLTRKGMPYAA